MNNFAVTVDSPSHSKLLQEIAFAHGYGWINGGQKVLHTGKKLLLFYPKDKIITHISITRKGETHLEDPSYQEFIDALNGEHTYEKEIGGRTVTFEQNHVSFTIDGVEVKLSHSIVEKLCDEIS